MIPIRDENPISRTPVVTFAIAAGIIATWVFIQGAGFSPLRLAISVCNYGMVPGEVTHLAPEGLAVPLGRGLACVVDREPINWLTPLTSMFLHGGWMHLLGNLLFFWVFADNVEDYLGRAHFLLFYLGCGLAAAFAQVAISPGSPVPVVGASGAISGVLGAYLVLFPRVRVDMLFIIFIFFRIIPLPAWLVLLWWFGIQLLQALPALAGAQSAVSGGVAVMAHVGGFLAGAYWAAKVKERRRFEYDALEPDRLWR
jgi:membrane associated rhomboid family serine protease